MRTRLATVVLVATILFAAVPPVSVIAQTATASTSSLIVKVVAGLAADQQTALVARNGGTVTSSVPALRLLVVSIPADDVGATLARYQADPQVQTAEHNKVRVSESIPADALYANQWALPRIGWDQVFGVITPSGSAKVAVLDTGVDASHPELAGKVVPGTSILDSSNGMTDPSGHGTWLAGIIAAQTNNGLEGIAGVAYAGVQIIPVTVLNSNGEGMDSDVIAGVIWAADHGADVILMAFSNPGFSPNLQDAIDYAWAKGAVIVASAGNNASSEPHFPAGDRGVMGVAATDQGDGQAPFSNEGQAVFIAAPGTDIVTTEPGGAYTAITGTSAAAAHVAGVAAFMKAVNPALPNGVIVFRIASTADPAGTQVETGNGRINMARALTSTANDFIQPAGAAPVGQGGPFVGPYTADAVSGDGSMTVSPTSVTAGAGNQTFTLAFSQTGTGNFNNGQLRVTVPAGWSTPQTSNALGAGHVSLGGVVGGNCTLSTALVSGTGPWTLTFNFENGCGNGTGRQILYKNVTAPSTAGSYQFTTATKAANSNFVNINTQPIVTVIAANTAPSVAFTTGATSVGESGTVQQNYTFSITDPDAGDSWSFVLGYPMCGSGGSLVAGSASINDAGKTGTFKCTFPDGPAMPTATVKVKDAAGAESNEARRDVSVANVAPTATLDTNAPVDEGSPVTITFSGQFDPSSVDTGTGFTYAFDCDTGAGYTSFGAINSVSCPTTDNGTRTVKGKIRDKDGGVSEYTAAVTINNVAPTATFNAPAQVNEGTAIALSLTNSLDPSSADTAAGFTYAFDCGTGAGYTAFGAITTVSCATDDNGSRTVKGKIRDKDGGVTGYSANVTINNVAPTATFTAPTQINEGTTIALSLTSPFDPSSADTAAGFTYAFDCGAGAGYTAFGAITTASCATDDNGSRAVKGKIRDKDGGVTEYSANVTINNVAPTATFTAPNPVNEGTALTLSLTNPFDPSSADTAAGFTYAFDCGDGAGYGAFGSSPSRSCPTTDNGSRSVKGKIRDKDGGVTEYIAAVTVNNVGPTIAGPVSGPTNPLAVPANATVTVSFTDPGIADTHFCDFVWDDGSASTVSASQSPSGGGSCVGTHPYAAAGVYTVSVTVRDDDGGSAGAKFEYVVVYDPSAGFVTGGGWIMSPPGAYIANLSLTGKANFGFVSKYKKGATVPTGETEFQFHAGELNFHSTEYQYLVIAGIKAQYKGVGTVNGAGNYGFLLTATDGHLKTGDGVDKFRIKIWDRVSGSLVYDNAQPAPGIDPATEDIDLIQPQAISGGSIVIHSGK
jgi:subtilisin family serine protease